MEKEKENEKEKRIYFQKKPNEFKHDKETKAKS